MTERKHARGTTVSVRQSLAELEDLLERFSNGQPTAFAYGNIGNTSTVQFELRGRRVRMSIHVPDISDYRTVNAGARGILTRSDADMKSAWQREVNRLWRSLVDVVKANLVAIDDGIITVEAAFLSGLVLPSGETVGERMASDLETTLRTGDLPPLMPGMPASARIYELGAGEGMG